MLQRSDPLSTQTHTCTQRTLKIIENPIRMYTTVMRSIHTRSTNLNQGTISQHPLCQSQRCAIVFENISNATTTAFMEYYVSEVCKQHMHS